MPELNGTRLWFKILGPLVPIILAGAVGYGTLKADQQSLRRDVDLKAAREVVESQNREILRELDALRQDIADLRHLVDGRVR